MSDHNQLQDSLDRLRVWLRDFGHLKQPVFVADLSAALNALDRLQTAVAEHHAQKADDRCWEDDAKVYAAAGLPPHDPSVGDKFEMLKNCARFIDRRCQGGTWPSYAELEGKLADALAVIETQRVLLAALRDTGCPWDANLATTHCSKHGGSLDQCPIGRLSSVSWKDVEADPTWEQSVPSCANQLGNEGQAVPRTCARCGLGPCFEHVVRKDPEELPGFPWKENSGGFPCPPT